MKIAAKIAAAACLLAIVSGFADAQSLADAARKAEEHKKSATAADTKKDAKTVYTNKDLDTAPESSSATPSEPSTPSDKAPLVVSPTIASDDAYASERQQARKALASGLTQTRTRIATYTRQLETLGTMCAPESYDGLSMRAAANHRQLCNQRRNEVDGLKKVVDVYAGAVEEQARVKGILPGITRDLLKEIGWPLP